MEETLAQFHSPQQIRRHRLRFTTSPANSDQFLSTLNDGIPTPASVGAGGLNLSLSSTHARSGAYNPTPMGPFTGYASILGRSRFLRPAQELLDDFCGGNGSGVFDLEKEASKLLEDSGNWFGDDEDEFSRRCNNPTLVSMLHEVYKRYKLYCQQMYSAVTSFESVAGLGNAAPFICLAIKAVFRHFYCLKTAILDHIQVSSKVFGGVGMKKGCSSSSCSEDKSSRQQQEVLDSHFTQHPVWRSQRGFPDRAVTVLRTWLFEHFLHPYPSDADKHMLAQKTGLSRNQVSNWFTNARVRLWKPMVEEMHTLERKTNATGSQKLVNPSIDNHLTSMHHPQNYMYRGEEDHNHCKRSRIEAFSSRRVEEERKEQQVQCIGITPYNHLSSNQGINLSGDQTRGHHPPSTLSSNVQENTTGLSWSTPGQMLPFWLAKQ